MSTRLTAARTARISAIAVTALVGGLFATAPAHGATDTSVVTGASQVSRDTYRLPGGGKLIVPSSSVSKGGQIVVGRAPTRKVPRYLRALGQPVALKVRHGHLTGPVKLVMPYRKKINAIGMPLDLSVQLGFYSAKRHTWETVPGHVNRIHRTVTATIAHFSWWNPLSWDWGSISLRLDQRVGELRGARSGPAKCSSGGAVPAWAAVLVNNAADMPIRTCAEGQGDTVVVQIVNNRPYGIVLRYGAPVQWGWHQLGNTAYDQVGTMLADKLVATDELYIPPTSAASVGIPRGSWGYVQFQASITAKSLAATAISIIVKEAGDRLPDAVLNNLVSSCSGLLQPKAGGGFQISTNALDWIASISQCFSDAMPKMAKAWLSSGQISQLQHASALLGRMGWAQEAVVLAGGVADLMVGRRADLQALATFGVRRRDVDPGPGTPPNTPGTPGIPPNTPGTPGTPPPAPVPLPPPPPAPLAEQSGSLGSPTFTNPYNASGPGARVPAMSWVQISCRVYAPAIASANPDGWWYRIATAPWSNSYYAVANTFWNGDIPGQKPYTHNTDWSVPVC